VRISLQRRSSGKPKTKKMRKFYTLSLIAAILTNISLTNSASAQYVSTVPGGYFNIASSWDSNGIPKDDWETITIPFNSRIISNENFSWGGKITIHGSFIAEKDFTTGYGGVDVYGELTVKGKLTNGSGGASFTIKNGARVIANEIDDNVNITVENGSTLIVNGDFAITQTLTIKNGGSVIINGKYLKGLVNNSGSLIVNGDYVNNTGGGIEIFGTGRTEVYGNMTGNQNFRVHQNGILLVHGCFASTGSNVHIQGTLVVAGDFLTSSSTTVNGQGNLIVGGDFKASGGINTKSDNLYIIDPNATIEYPGNGNKKDYGDLDGLLDDDDFEFIKELIEEVIPDIINYSTINQWIGTAGDGKWNNPLNWSGNKLPAPGTNVRIKSSASNPVIPTGLHVQVKNLTINPSAKLTLAPGSQLTVDGDLYINTPGGLVQEHKYGANGMSSLLTHGLVSGTITTRVELPHNRWFYIGSSKKDAVFSDFGAGEEGVVISVYRSNDWWTIGSGLASRLLRPLEGMATNYLPSVVDNNGYGKPDSRIIEYTGKPQTEVVNRTFDIAGFHLLANPFTSFIDWQDGAGWERVNVDHTIWYRTKIGEEMTFVTYNNSPDVANMARIAISPYSLGEITPEIVEEHSKIAPMQAVWIKTLSPNASVNLYPESRNHGTAISRLKGSSESGNVIRIEAENEFSRDGAVVFFKNGFTEAKDNGDSEKYFNDSKNIPEVYTIASGKPLAISGLPELSEDYRAIPLSVKNRIEGSVTLKFDLRYFNNEYTAYLEDRYTGTYINLLQNNSYTYTVLKLGEVNDRFVVHLHNITTGIEEVLPEQGQTDGSDFIKIRSLGDKVLVSVSAELIQAGQGTIEVYSIDGRKLSDIPAASSRTFLILPQERGIYIVRAIFGIYVKSERIINSTR
jgi:hypothetical protein